MEVDRRIANLDEQAALPRKNGELVFQAPWEGRAFGMAVLLNEKGAYEWNAFRDRLVAEIAGGVEQRNDYYASWLDALQSLLIEKGVVTPEQIDRRAGEYRLLERDPVF
jgi:nitrile hydratase accessory protein